MVNNLAAMPRSDVLTDSHGRILRKLRISITEACNLRCRYCMPQNAKFAPHDELVPPDELVEIARGLVDLGIDSIRITGGEPTLRPEFPEIARGLCGLGVDVGLTTNGFRLAELAQDLARFGLQGANVSLDSLSPDNFRRLARGGSLDTVLAGIRAAQDAGLSVKINMVVMRGWNDHEIEAFHDFSVEHDVEVRFLELMRIGEALAFFDERFFPASEMLSRLQAHSPLHEIPVDHDATAFRRVSEAGARLGFIASESRPFCSGCSRLRLSAKGALRSCLFKEDSVSLRGVSRQNLSNVVRQVVDLKPLGRITSIGQAMHTIGG